MSDSNQSEDGILIQKGWICTNKTCRPTVLVHYPTSCPYCNFDVMEVLYQRTPKKAPWWAFWRENLSCRILNPDKESDGNS